ncbi:hypothetical protein NDN08_001416 [Rhodosorus marinus]|uniref:Uncharacterized protein n=1 Tax=Rhodosorus marinus TaxID=101924 RepID=A0AAV8UUX0_9RHOD|nr:hypothetical protein NDN08_001416 [Rhodosorus marinus]
MRGVGVSRALFLALVLTIGSALEEETGAWMGSSEEVVNIASEKIRSHEGSGSKTSDAKKLATAVLADLVTLNNTFETEKNKLEESVLEHTVLESTVNQMSSEAKLKQKTAEKEKQMLEAAKEQNKLLEKQIKELTDDREAQEKSKKELEELVEKIKLNLHRAKLQLDTLSDTQVENWVRAKIDSFGQILGSPESSSVLTDVLDGVERFSNEASGNFYRLSENIDKTTRFPAIGFLTSLIIFAIPVLLFGYLMNRVWRRVNIRGVILVMDTALLSYFVTCLILALMRFNVQNLTQASRRQVLMVQLLLASITPILAVLSFVSAVFGALRREKLFYSLHFISLGLVVGLISDHWSLDSVRIYAPSSYSVLWYLFVCLSFVGNIALTLNARKIASSEVLASDMQDLVNAGGAALGLSTRQSAGLPSRNLVYPQYPKKY